MPAGGFRDLCDLAFRGLVIIRRALDAETIDNRAMISRLWSYARRRGAASSLMLRQMLALALVLAAFREPAGHGSGAAKAASGLRD